MRRNTDWQRPLWTLSLGVAVALAALLAQPQQARAQGEDVSAELGGAGFKGEGWQTAKSKPLGEAKAKKGGSITTNIREWPGNLRMAGTAYNTWLNYTVRDLCYMSLLSIDPNTLEYLPGLATHWQISEDQMTYRFRIDPRAKWSDGKPVIADDVVATWSLHMDDTLLDPSGKMTYGKLNKPVAKSKYILEVTAIDKNWRNLLYFSGMGIMPAHEIGKITGKEYLDKYNYAYVAFNGPYMVKPEDIIKGTSLTLTRRDDWWAKDDEQYKGLYNFDKIRFVVYLDQDTSFLAATKGDIDYFLVQRAEWWARDLPKIPAVEKGWLVRQKIYNDAPVGTQGIALNQRKAPLNDLNVRKALQYLMDREKMIRTLAYNEYKPLDSYYQGGEYQNPGNEKIRFNQKKAFALLNEAGYTTRGADGILVKGDERLSITVSYYNPVFEKYLTTFTEDCKKVGVEIKLELVNPETSWKNLMDRKFQSVMIAWGALVFPNPETSFKGSLAEVNDNNNITGVNIAKCDELFKAYDVAFTQEERRKIVREIDGLVYKDHPYVLLWYQPCQRVLYWNKFGMPDYGFHRTLEWEDAFASWWLDPEKEAALDAARKADKSLTPPPLEIKVWEQKAESSAK